MEVDGEDAAMANAAQVLSEEGEGLNERAGRLRVTAALTRVSRIVGPALTTGRRPSLHTRDADISCLILRTETDDGTGTATDVTHKALTH